MPEIEIRSAIATDIPYLLKINHNFTSERVWQMEIQREDNHLEIVFREVKLPRSVQVSYPVDFHTLPDLWNQRSVILVAVIDGAPIGYIGLMENLSPKSVWVSDFAIEPKHRRQGVGTALMLSARDWAKKRKEKCLVMQIQPKNYPAICFAYKLGFEFCGYRDRHFGNGDIALFFEKWIK